VIAWLLVNYATWLVLSSNCHFLKIIHCSLQTRPERNARCCTETARDAVVKLDSIEMYSGIARSSLRLRGILLKIGQSVNFWRIKHSYQKQVRPTNVLWIRYCISENGVAAIMPGADRCCAVYHFHSPGGSTCLRELTLQQLSARNDVMAAVLKLWGQFENPTRQSIRIFTRETIVPNFIPIGFETALGFFVIGRPNKKKNKNKMSSDMRSGTWSKNMVAYFLRATVCIFYITMITWLIS